MSLSESIPVFEVSDAQTVIVAAGAAPAISRPSQAREASVQSPSPKVAGYGLPCVKCRTYYAADLKACPVCKSTERMGPVTGPVSASTKLNEKLPDPIALEEERERFLREFNAQAFSSPVQPDVAMSGRCTKEEIHHGAFEAAAVCQECYDHLQERVDVLEAAMHMDVTEAAQIVYDAVWSDPSDPSKTYQNAAQALLSELRKRAGIMPIFGALAPLPD